MKSQRRQQISDCEVSPTPLDRASLDYSLTNLESKGQRELTVKTSSSPSSASLWMVEDDVVEPKKIKKKRVVRRISKDDKSKSII